VVAATQSGGIGLKGSLPWAAGSLPADVARFKELTAVNHPDGKLNVVMMGRHTWDSIPEKFRPLPNRINIILSNHKHQEQTAHIANVKNVYVLRSLVEALHFIRTLPNASTKDGSVFVIGGAALYREALTNTLCHTIHLTRVLAEFEADTFFCGVDCATALDADGKQSPWRLTHVGPVQTGPAVASGGLVPFQFQTIERRVKSHELGNTEEEQYLGLVRHVMNNGNLKGDRTGTGTFSLFGEQMRFSLRGGVIPLLTTKKVFWRGVVEELLWLIKGCTDSKALAEKNVHVSKTVCQALL